MRGFSQEDIFTCRVFLGLHYGTLHYSSSLACLQLQTLSPFYSAYVSAFHDSFYLPILSYSANLLEGI